MDKFTYLGSTLSRNTTIDDEVNTRISRASSSFGRLYKNVWHRSGISLQTKLKVYKAAVLPVLLYACETWTVYRRHSKMLNHFHTKSLRKILNIQWQQKIPDTVVLEKAGIPSIDTILMQHQLRWAGHVTRMPDHRLPKQIFYSELKNGKRTQGGQKKRFKDTLKCSLNAFGLNPDTWEVDAQDRTSWRASLHSGATSCETARRTEAEQKRLVRKTKNANPASAAAIPCPHCPRTFRARIGLISHIRTHRHS